VSLARALVVAVFVGMLLIVLRVLGVL